MTAAEPCAVLVRRSQGRKARCTRPATTRYHGAPYCAWHNPERQRELSAHESQEDSNGQVS